MSENITATNTTGIADLDSLSISSGTITYPSLTTSGSGMSISGNGSNVYTSPSYVWTTTGGGMNEDEVKTLIQKELQKKIESIKREIDNSYIALTGDYLWIIQDGKQIVAHVMERVDDQIYVLAPNSVGDFEYFGVAYDTVEGEATLSDWVGQEKAIYKEKSK